MKKRAIFLAVTTSLGLAIQHPLAQGATTPLKLTSNPDSLQTCFAHVGRCIVPVYIHPLPQGHCSAWIDPGKIIVPQPDTVPGGSFKPARIKIVWVIKKGDPSVKMGEYAFDASAGVKPRGTTDQFVSEGVDGPDTDNPDPDDPPDSAAVNRRFRWRSTHLKTGVDLQFDLNIRRVSRVGGVLVVIPCDAADPLISNT